MTSRTKKHAKLAAIFAVISTLFYVAHIKIGGLLAGAVYSTPHSWNEVLRKLPSFLYFFLMVFGISFLFLHYIAQARK